jgi:hypothetical protein
LLEKEEERRGGSLIPSHIASLSSQPRTRNSSRCGLEILRQTLLFRLLTLRTLALEIPAGVDWKFSGGCSSFDRWLGGLPHWKFQAAAWNFSGGAPHTRCASHTGNSNSGQLKFQLILGNQ